MEMQAIKHKEYIHIALLISVSSAVCLVLASIINMAVYRVFIFGKSEVIRSSEPQIKFNSETNFKKSFLSKITKAVCLIESIIYNVESGLGLCLVGWRSRLVLNLGWARVEV